MLIERWMKLEVHTVKPRDSVAHARALLEEYRINQLPVVVDGRLVGIVTDRDLRDVTSAASSAMAEAQSDEPIETDPARIAVDTVMSTNVFTVTPKDTLEHAAKLMRKERIGALPVVEKGHLRGIITRSDMLDAFLSLGASAKGE